MNKLRVVPNRAPSETTKFDYGELDDETCKIVQDARDHIQQLGRQTAENIIEMGRWLTEVKQRLPWGQWGDWLASELPWISESTAANWINVAVVYNSTTVVELPPFTALLGHHPAAAYELSRPSVPEPARQEVLKRVADGQILTTTQVRETAHRHKVEHAREAAARMHVEPVVITAGSIRTEPTDERPQLGAAYHNLYRKPIEARAQETAGKKEPATVPAANTSLEIQDNGDPVAYFMAAYRQMDNLQRNELAKQILEDQLRETDLLPQQKAQLTTVLEVLTDYRPRTRH